MIKSNLAPDKITLNSIPLRVVQYLKGIQKIKARQIDSLVFNQTLLSP